VRTGGGIVRKAPGAFEVVDLELDDPRQGELRVTMVASGLCHSDYHLATGYTPVATFSVRRRARGRRHRRVGRPEHAEFRAR
jgi:Zn-dependent alcohol dehydrogenase